MKLFKNEGPLSAPTLLLWLVHSHVLLGAALICLFFPDWIVDFYQAPKELVDILHDEIRSAVPLLVGLALLFGSTAMRDMDEVRHEMADMLALVTSLFTLVLLTANLVPADSLAVKCFTGAMVASSFVQALHVLWPRKQRVKPRQPGQADTKPPQVWALWALQGSVSLLAGVLLLVVPWSDLSDLWFNLPGPPLAAEALQLGTRFQKISGIAFMALGLFTFSAMRLSRAWEWRLYCVIFTVVSLLFFLVTVLTWDARHTGWGTTLPAPVMLIFMLSNLVYWLRHEDPVGEELERTPASWALSDIIVGPALALQALLYRRRATHLAGVGASGYMRVVRHPRFPCNAFFKPGMRFTVQMRFATLTSTDDASNDIRGAALRLSNHADVPSPFDMLMNSGAFCATPNLASFAMTVFSRFLGKRITRAIVRSSLQLREALIAGRRRAPACFSRLRYYSQTVRFWGSEDDVRYLVRYRLIYRRSYQAESGLATPEEEDTIWVRERLPTEHRPTNYLREELKQRLTQQGPLMMRLQAQFHRMAPGDTVDWYNSSVDWPEEDHPWVDIGLVVLTAPLPDEHTEVLRFNTANHPPCLGVPSSPSIFDYRSLADSEQRIVYRLQQLRLKIYHLLGMPSFEAELLHLHQD